MECKDCIYALKEPDSELYICMALPPETHIIVTEPEKLIKDKRVNFDAFKTLSTNRSVRADRPACIYFEEKEK